MPALFPLIVAGDESDCEIKNIYDILEKFPGHLRKGQKV
jgi:hypothetical protein